MLSITLLIMFQETVFICTHQPTTSNWKKIRIGLTEFNWKRRVSGIGDQVPEQPCEPFVTKFSMKFNNESFFFCRKGAAFLRLGLKLWFAHRSLQLFPHLINPEFLWTAFQFPSRPKSHLRIRSTDLSSTRSCYLWLLKKTNSLSMRNH